MSRIDDILAGKTNLPAWKVEVYRELYGSGPAVKPLAKPPITEDKAFAKFPCVHRELTDETYVCKPCAGAREHTVCICRLLNDARCTVRASGASKMLFCIGCEYRKGE